MSENNHPVPVHFRVGKIECIVINEVSTTRNLTQMFANVPPEDLSSAAGSMNVDAENAPFAMNVLFINTGQHKLLIDTGIGAPVMPGSGQIPQQLAGLGIPADQINVVVITHAHGDHVGGVADDDGNAIYPNARYVMWKSEWECWTSEEIIAAMPEQDAANTRKRIAVIRDRLTLLDTESEIVPGIWAIPSPGHTVGHMAIAVKSDGESLIHIADAAHHPTQVAHPDWSPRFDFSIEQSVPSRQALFERVAKENALMLAYHFAFPGLGYVKREGSTLHWQWR